MQFERCFAKNVHKNNFLFTFNPAALRPWGGNGNDVAFSKAIRILTIRFSQPVAQFVLYTIEYGSTPRCTVLLYLAELYIITTFDPRFSSNVLPKSGCENVQSLSTPHNQQLISNIAIQHKNFTLKQIWKVFRLKWIRLEVVLKWFKCYWEEQGIGSRCHS